MPKYKVFYTLKFDGAMEVEADTPDAAWEEILGWSDQQLTDEVDREWVRLRDIQDPDTNVSYPIHQIPREG